MSPLRPTVPSSCSSYTIVSGCPFHSAVLQAPLALSTVRFSSNDSLLRMSPVLSSFLLVESHSPCGVCVSVAHESCLQVVASQLALA